MTEGNVSAETRPINPLLTHIDANFHDGSVRELISKAMKETTPWDLPEDPEELKKVLSDAIEHAVSLKKAP